MIRVTRRVIRFLGWLLTPVIAWAAAFLGGRVGADLAALVESPKGGFALMVAVAAVFAGCATWLWAWAIRRSARLQAWSRRRARQRRVDVPPQTNHVTVDVERTPAHTKRNVSKQRVKGAK